MQECTGKQEDGHATSIMKSEVLISTSSTACSFPLSELTHFPNESKFSRPIQSSANEQSSWEHLDFVMSSWKWLPTLPPPAILGQQHPQFHKQALPDLHHKVQHDLAPNIPGHCSQEMFAQCAVGKPAVQKEKQNLQTCRYYSLEQISNHKRSRRGPQPVVITARKQLTEDNNTYCPEQMTFVELAWFLRHLKY